MSVSHVRFVLLYTIIFVLATASLALCPLRQTPPTGYGPRPRTKMAESKTSAIVPLSGANYPTWKVQCRMALVRDGLWGIVSGTETAPTEGGDRRSKFLAQ